MLSQGHAEAWSYPVWMVQHEARVVVKRQNSILGTEAILMQMALLSVPNERLKPSATKSIARDFANEVKRLTGD